MTGATDSTDEVANSRLNSVQFGMTIFTLMAMWSIAMPLFSSPDENAHFVKAAALVRGVLVGKDLSPTADLSYWSTAVDIDPQFNAANQIPWCFAPYAAVPACDRPMATTDPVDNIPYTTHGRYPPLLYIVPGLATLFGPTDFSVRLARLLVAGAAATILALAFAHLRRCRRALPALLLAFTPGVLFLSSTVNTSGLEICAAIATWIFVPAAMRGELATRSDRLAMCVSLVTLTTARPIGPVLTAITLAICAAASPAPRRTWRVVRAHWATAVISSVAALAMTAWYFAIYSEHVSSSVVAGQPAYGATRVTFMAVGHLPKLVAEAVGNYGWLDTPTPTPLVWGFLFMVMFGIFSMWPRCSRRERYTLAVLSLCTATLSIGLDLNYYQLLRQVGVQGRWLMPLLVGLPLLLVHHWTPSRWAERNITLAWAAITAGAGLFALRRYTVGVTEGNFLTMFTDPAWTPLFGVLLSATALIALPFAVATIILRSADGRELGP
ncbi:hypothetical protein BH10ACT2_BH10ACT2_00070 [soil metagenome]